MQLSLVLAVIGNLATGTCRTPWRLPSHANDDSGLSLLHTFQDQPSWPRQGISHNINGLAHGFNISNLSSLHRKCARTDLSAARHVGSTVPWPLFILLEKGHHRESAEPRQ